VHAAVAKLLEYKHNGLDPRIYVVKGLGVDLEKAKAQDFNISEDLGLIVSVKRTTPDGTTFSAAHAWGWDKWNYDYSRWDLKALLYASRKVGITAIDGVMMSDNLVTQVRAGKVLAIEALRDSQVGSWHPEDFVDPRSVEFKDEGDFEHAKKIGDEVVAALTGK
jgi:hypothetical protein